MPRRRPKKQPAAVPAPPSMVVRLGKAIVKQVGDLVYRRIRALEQDARASGFSFRVSDYTLDQVVHKMPHREIQAFVQQQIEEAIETHAIGSAFGFDDFHIDADFGEGKIVVSTKVPGEDILDPDQDVEVPASEDLITDDIRAALRDLECKSFSVDWTLGESPYAADLTEIVYMVRARWEFDPHALLVKVLNPARLPDINLL